MRNFELVRRLETSQSLTTLRWLSNQLDVLCANGEKLLSKEYLDPKTKFLVSQLVADDMFTYRQAIADLIKVLEEEQSFYGDGSHDA